MIRGRAKVEIQRILEAASFEVEMLNEHVDLSAYRDDECLVVLCSNDKPEIETFDRVRYQVQTDSGLKDCLKLLFSLIDTVQTKNCIEWGMNEMVTYAGQAALANILDRELALDFGHTPIQKMDVPLDSGPEIPHLPIKISKERAALISGVKGSAACRFIPHWHYHYVSSGEKVFKDRMINFDDEGSGAISAINGLETEIDLNTVEESGIPANSNILNPTIMKEEAMERIIAQVMDDLTQGVRVKQTSGDTILSEDKILKPDRKNIRVDLNLVYIPVWQIKGKKFVEVNAYTGDILCEPMDEGVELI